MLNHDQKSTARGHLLKLYNYKQNLHAETVEAVETSMESLNISSSNDDFLFNEILKEKGTTQSDNGDSNEAIATKIRDFEFIRSTDMDATKYWMNRQLSDPELCSLALTVFQVPGSQVTVERNFSSWKWIFNERRKNIDPSLMDDIMIINLNNKFQSG